MARKRRMRSQSGFTLIELLVVVIIIGILAAIALPNFIGAQDKAREATVKSNMRTAQLAAEAYATDQAGTYPAEVGDAYKSYFPGGESDGQTAAANGPVNAFTGVNQFPTFGALSSAPNAVQQLRSQGGETGAIGEIRYLAPSVPNTYAIIGFNKKGEMLGGQAPGTFLVLSNQ